MSDRYDPSLSQHFSQSTATTVAVSDFIEAADITAEVSFRGLKSIDASLVKGNASDGGEGELEGPSRGNRKNDRSYPEEEAHCEQ